MTEPVYSPRSFVEEIDARRRTITVFAPPDEADAAGDLTDHFGTHNVSIEARRIPEGREGFVVVRSEGLPQRTVPLGAIKALLAGDRSSDWGTLPKDADTPSTVVGLDELSFQSFDRAQMLFTTREIEERAYRVGRGTLYVGFQRAEAFAAQHDVYEALLTRGVEIDAYVADTFPSSRERSLRHPNLTYHVESVPDLADFWFLAFDGGGEPLQECALVAEERTADHYYGVWTYEPALVVGFIGYLKSTY